MILPHCAQPQPQQPPRTNIVTVKHGIFPIHKSRRRPRIFHPLSYFYWKPLCDINLVMKYKKTIFILQHYLKTIAYMKRSISLQSNATIHPNYTKLYGEMRFIYQPLLQQIRNNFSNSHHKGCEFRFYDSYTVSKLILFICFCTPRWPCFLW